MCRCLDVCLENEIERMHAIRLIRHINTVAPKEMPRSLVYSIIAVGNDGSTEHDRFVRVCLATLCEIGKYSAMCWDWLKTVLVVFLFVFKAQPIIKSHTDNA